MISRDYARAARAGRRALAERQRHPAGASVAVPSAEYDHGESWGRRLEGVKLIGI
jgi:hypothetical protein